MSLVARRGHPIEAVARAHGVSVLQAALPWLLAKSPVMLPIPGTSSVAHLEDDLAAARIRLSAAELTALWLVRSGREKITRKCPGSLWRVQCLLLQS